MRSVLHNFCLFCILLVYSLASSKEYHPDFAWGVATAAYQIEGAANIDGRGPSIWDEFCTHEGRIKGGHNGDVAVDFYHRYKEDIQIMQQLGIKHFRMSISWSRIMSNGTLTSLNPKGVEFYNKVINELLGHGIKPWVTLYHWDLPAALNNKSNSSGWLDPEIVHRFNEYADFCFKTFGDRVKAWVTFNEPRVFTMNGYGSGNHAPGRCTPNAKNTCQQVGGGGNSTIEPFIVAKNLLIAHALAVKTYRDRYQKLQKGVIGMTIDGHYAEPSNPQSQDDIYAAERSLQVVYGWFADPIVFGDWPEVMKKTLGSERLPEFNQSEKALLKNSTDYLGLNHYSSRFAKFRKNVTGSYEAMFSFSLSEKNDQEKSIGLKSNLFWLIKYPQGFRKLLKWISLRYRNPVIYVFENGASNADELIPGPVPKIKDKFRKNYYKDYLKQLELSVKEDNVDVRGYFAWSLMDNFEWTRGYDIRFGLVYIDYSDNLKRYIKDSGYFYSKWIKEHTKENGHKEEL